MKRKRNRGVTIAEAIVAMAIILVVSGSAIVMINSYSTFSADMLVRTEALAMSENALECFKTSDSYEEFVGLLFSISDMPLDDPRHEVQTRTVPVDPDDPTLGTREEVVSEWGSFSYAGVGFTVNFRVTYEEGTARFSVYALDRNGQSILAVDNYMKAVRS